MSIKALSNFPSCQHWSRHFVDILFTFLRITKFVDLLFGVA